MSLAGSLACAESGQEEAAAADDSSAGTAGMRQPSGGMGAAEESDDDWSDDSGDEVVQPAAAALAAAAAEGPVEPGVGKEATAEESEEEASASDLEEEAEAEEQAGLPTSNKRLEEIFACLSPLLKTINGSAFGLAAAPPAKRRRSAELAPSCCCNCSASFRQWPADSKPPAKCKPSYSGEKVFVRVSCAACERKQDAACKVGRGMDGVPAAVMLAG